MNAKSLLKTSEPAEPIAGQDFAFPDTNRSTPRVTLLEPSNPRWKFLLGQLAHDFYHLPGYVATCAIPVQGEAVAFHVESGGNHLLLPMILRPVPDFGDSSMRGWRDACSPYGYPGPIVATESGEPSGGAAFAARAIQALLEKMRELKILTAFVRFHPLLDTPLDAFAARGELIHHGRTVSIDLRLTAEEIWRQTRRNHRSQITQLREAGGIVVERDTEWRHLNQFIVAYQDTMDRVGAQRSYYFDASYYEGLRAALEDKVHLFILKIRDQIAAAAIITEVCGIAQYHLAATFSEFVKHHPHKLLFHEVSLWAKAQGNKILHLGGGLGGQEDDLYHFKAGFSPRRHPFHTWRVRCDEVQYQRVMELWKETARSASVDPTFFPAYRQLGTHSPA